MTKALLDTTLVYDQLIGSTAQKKSARAALASYADTRTVVYAFRELRSGALGSWILAYNTLAEAKTIEEAVNKLFAVGQAAPRRAQVGIKALVRGLVAGQKVTGIPEQDQRKQLLAYLGEQIVRAWDKRKASANKVSHPLSCFLQDDLVLDGKKLWPKGGRLGCQPGVSCSAALHLREYEGDIKKLVDVLRPAKKNAAPQKPELTHIRAALKEVLDAPKGEFPRSKCRNLGDAYFCLVAEIGEHIVTTNKGDFELLTKAIGKTAINP